MREFHNAINWNINEIKESICIYTFFLLNGPNIKYKFQISLTFTFGSLAKIFAIFNICNFTLWLLFFCGLLFIHYNVSPAYDKLSTKQQQQTAVMYFNCILLAPDYLNVNFILYNGWMWTYLYSSNQSIKFIKFLETIKCLLLIIFRMITVLKQKVLNLYL